MLLFAPKETAPGENRVAITPDSAKRLAAVGIEAAIEAGAGLTADYPDKLYEDAGVRIFADGAEGWAAADAVACVRPAAAEDAARMKAGALLIGLLEPHGDTARVGGYAEADIAAFSFEFVPRISRAQGMDALSSQANLAGYASVILAAERFSRAFPMMVTAAGTVSPARVLILGAGVAGLQAIATARRLGAVVSAMDVRDAAREQVESLGAAFVTVEAEEKGEGTGGYAKEMSDDYKRRQAAKLRETLSRTDICITTAQIPGRSAPVLLPSDMLSAMKPGSIVIDLAASSGGNCEVSKNGETMDVGGVNVIGASDLPSAVAQDASNLYGRNVLNFLAPLMDADSKALKIDWEDEIVAGALLTRDGAIVHSSLKGENA
jgi:H+-translocating NAD(P) transhydrogenase subunit alpha